MPYTCCSSVKGGGSGATFSSSDQFFKAGDHNHLHPPEQVADWEWAKGQALHGGTLRLLFTGC